MLARFRLACAVLATGAALIGLPARGAPTPGVPTLHLADQTSGSTAFTNLLTVKLLVTDAPAGVHIFSFSIAPPAAADPNWSTILTTFAFPDDGLHRVYWWVKDASDAIASPDIAGIIVDRRDPETTLDLPAVTESTSVPATIAANDNATEFGDLRYILKTDSIEPFEDDAAWAAKPDVFDLPPGDGAKTLYLWARDLAGNVSPVASDTTVLDTHAPTATLAPLPPITRSRTIAIAVGGADLGGLTRYLVSESAANPLPGDAHWVPTVPTAFVITSPGDGVKTIRAWTKDVAGHVSAPAVRTITLDSTLPTAAIAAPATTNVNTVTATISGSDAGGTGVAAYYANTGGGAPAPNAIGWSAAPGRQLTLPGADGLKTVYGWTKDAAGNVSARASTSVRLDRTAPTATLTGPSRSRTTTLAIIIGGADGGSGVAGYLLSTLAPHRH